jgi:hypothetical protein
MDWLTGCWQVDGYQPTLLAAIPTSLAMSRAQQPTDVELPERRVDIEPLRLQ